MNSGIAGKIAKTFLTSKLTVLLMIAFMFMGLFGWYLIPREEEPQIEVPIADIFVRYQGANPKEVETKVTKPLEKIVSNIPGVEYVYSTSMDGKAMIIVQFYVKQDIERSLVKLYNEIIKHMDQMPQGVSLPIIKTRAIDDVPIQALTLWSKKYNDYQLKQIAQEVVNKIKDINGIASTKIIGGRKRQINVVLDKAKMSENHVDFLAIAKNINASNQQVIAGNIDRNDTNFVIQSGDFLRNVTDVKNLIVGVNHQSPVYLKQIATVTDGPEKPNEYVYFGYGKSSVKEKRLFPSEYQAVTISIAKQKGTDAMHLVSIINDRIAHLKTNLIPNDVHVSVTRNYGKYP